MPTINAIPGDPNANSFCDEAFADNYFANNSTVDKATQWAAIPTSAAQQGFLIEATRRLNQEFYGGEKASQSQALKHPRIGMEDEDGYEYRSDVVVDCLKFATCELALILSAKPAIFADTGLEGFENIKIEGALDITPKDNRESGALPAHVARFISHILSGGGITWLVRA